MSKKTTKMIQLNIQSVAMNSNELIKELKHIIWKLEHSMNPNNRVVKINYGHQYVEIVELNINPKVVLKSLLGV